MAPAVSFLDPREQLQAHSNQTSLSAKPLIRNVVTKKKEGRKNEYFSTRRYIIQQHIKKKKKNFRRPKFICNETLIGFEFQLKMLRTDKILSDCVVRQVSKYFETDDAFYVGLLLQHVD